MCDHTNPSKIPSLNLEISLQDLGPLACKPSKVKDTDTWFCKLNKRENSSGVPIQNTNISSAIEPCQESRIKEVKNIPSVNESKEALEVKMEVQRKALLEAFNTQMAKKMEEMDQKICKKWGEAVSKMHEQYEQKLEKYGEVLKDMQNRTEENLQQQKMRLEQQITDKYHQEFLSKSETLKQEFQHESSSKIVEVLVEVKTKLEMDCEEKYQFQRNKKQEEIKQEAEQIKKEQYSELLKSELAMNIEKNLKAEHEAALSNLTTQNQRNITALKKDLKELEQGRAYERIKAELLEEMRREYVVKEDEMNKFLKEKLVISKKEANEDIEEQRLSRRFSQDNLNPMTGKKEMALMDNARIKRAEEYNKGLERQLAEKEENYLKTVEELKKELDELKASRNILNIPNSARPSVRNTSTERESMRPTHQRNSSKSTERLRRSCDGSLADILGVKGESANKACNTARSRRESWTSEKKTTNKGADKSSESKKNTLKQPNFNQYFQPFSTERTAKALLQMLSPSTSSDLYYIRGDTRLETMQGPISEVTKIAEEANELKEAENAYKRQEVIVTPQKTQNQRSCSTLRGRVMASTEKEMTPNRFEDTLKQKNLNLHCRRASMTERKVDLKGSQAERNRNVDKMHTNRYEELLKRQTSAVKTRGNSISNKKENVSGFTEKSGRKQEIVRGRYENQENILSERKSYTAKSAQKNIFEIKDNDDEETKRMKKLKKIVEDRFYENDLLASKCQKKEVDLCINFPWRTTIQSIEQEKTIQDKLKTLFELWKAIEMSSVTKLAFMEELEQLIYYDAIIQKIGDEINFIAQLATETEAITKLLTWRGQLRDQIKVSDYSQDLYEKIYTALERNNRELREALEYYQRENGKFVQFKGVDLNEIIQLDSWENEYLRNTKPRLSSPQKVQKAL